MVRVERIELSSQPWEGYILATIRYPRLYNYWSHLPGSNPKRTSGTLCRLERSGVEQLEPPCGIEPQTFSLRVRRSTN
jgi:hypothetical protein